MSVKLTVCWKRSIREKAGEQGDTWKRKKKKTKQKNIYTHTHTQKTNKTKQKKPHRAQAKENALEQRCFENNCQVRWV